MPKPSVVDAVVSVLALLIIAGVFYAATRVTP